LTAPVVTVDPASDSPLKIGTNMGWLTDETRKRNLADVEAEGELWRAIERPSPNFGFSNAAHWFRFMVFVPGEQPLARYLELPVPFIDSLQVFHRLGDSTLAQFQLGDALPFAERPVHHQNFVMPLSLQPGTNIFYVRIFTTGTVEASFRLWPHDRFVTESNRENLANGAVAGVLLVMVLYNLFVGLSLRDGNYLLYIGFVASYLLFYFSLTGYTYQYLWPEAMHWNSIAISTFIASTIVFTAWFATSFLRLASAMPKTHRLFQAMAAAGGVLLMATLVLPYAWTIRVGTALAMPVAIAALVVGYWRWAKGAQFARFFCLAWTALLIGIVVLNANKLGLIEANVWTNNASQIGVILQVLLLSFTLADRMNHDRVRRIRAQEAALTHERDARESSQALVRAIEEANRELEHRVTARTADLHQAMDQLQTANLKLTELSTTDALTQVRNRAFFDQALHTEISRASRTGSPLSLVMFDIDHFKKINDTYGHPAGDACLRAVADTAGQVARRRGDVVARYGGEEFAVVLIDIDLPHTLMLIEDLRARLQAQTVAFDGHTIRFTASFGVAHGHPKASTQGEHLLSVADKALYRAKHEGRNCVQHDGY
jgi:diguanylate cyclase